MLRTTLPGSDDGSFRRVFKALLLSEKEETKKVILAIYFASRVGILFSVYFIKASFDIFCLR